MTKKPLLLATAVLAVLAVSGCKKEGGAGAQQGQPPPQVGTLTLQVAPLTLTLDLPGRTLPYRVAEVRPQVSGVVLKRLFQEGGEVKAGQPLYQIDPAPFQATLASAQAALARADAMAAMNKSIVDRYVPLVDTNAVSKQEYDNAVASLRSAEADVASAKAQVQTAQINLTYTKVLSPISGQAGRTLITEGALVTANQEASLVVIQQLDPIYVDMTQPSVTLLNLRRQLASGKLKRAGENAAESKLKLEDGSDYGEVGKLQFSEVTVEQGTGSVTLRAIFPNPDKLLLPGMFVHATIEQGEQAQALLVPQQAVTRNQKGDPTALVVAADGTVGERKLKTDRAIGSDWLVSDGLAAGDRVVVQGLQSAHAGAKVTTREVTREQLQAASNPEAQTGNAGKAPPQGDAAAKSEKH